MPQGVRRGIKKQRRASSGVGKGRSDGGVATPVAVVLPRVDATALPRPPPTPSPMVARARNLREAAARAEAQNEASFSNGGGSRVICACHRPLVLDLQDSVPARGWMRFAGGGASLCVTHRCASLVVFLLHVQSTISSSFIKQRCEWCRQKKRSTSTSGSLEATILSRTMPTCSLSVFEMTIFRNSTHSGTEFCCL